MDGTEKYQLVVEGLKDPSAKDKLRDLLEGELDFKVAEIDEFLDSMPVAVRGSDSKVDLVPFFQSLRDVGAEVLIVQSSDSKEPAVEQVEEVAKSEPSSDEEDFSLDFDFDEEPELDGQQVVEEEGDDFDFGLDLSLEDEGSAEKEESLDHGDTEGEELVEASAEEHEGDKVDFGLDLDLELEPIEEPKPTVEVEQEASVADVQAMEDKEDFFDYGEIVEEEPEVEEVEEENPFALLDDDDSEEEEGSVEETESESIPEILELSEEQESAQETAELDEGEPKPEEEAGELFQLDEEEQPEEVAQHQEAEGIAVEVGVDVEEPHVVEEEPQVVEAVQEQEEEDVAASSTIKEIGLPLLGGLLILVGLNWFIMNRDTDNGSSEAALVHEMEQLSTELDVFRAEASKVAEEGSVVVSDKPAPPVFFSVDQPFLDVHANGQVVINKGTFASVKLELDLPPSPKLTEMEIVEGLKRAPWINKVDIEKVVSASFEGSLMSAEVEMKVYVQDARRRFRKLVTGQLVGEMDPDTNELKFGLKFQHNRPSPPPGERYGIQRHAAGVYSFFVDLELVLPPGRLDI